MKKGKIIKSTFKILLLLFLLFNVLVAVHAYKFTHFTTEKVKRTKKPELLSFSEKLNVLFTGVNNPRPIDTAYPERKFEHITIKSNKKLDCWLIRKACSRGTVILFHGYGSNKSALLDNATFFIELGYNTLLVDFMGSGGSEGNQTTTGFKEAQEVKSCFDYVQQKGEKNIFLYGVSMGAASILKAMHDYPINPKGIILECPFGSMYKTVCNRFNNMGIPTFPAAGLLTFWGGVENGFWAFSYKPSEYAKTVKCPTMLMYGAKDKNVSREEIDEIYANLGGKKRLTIFPEAGHENYLVKYPDQWEDSLRVFLYDIEPPDMPNDIMHCDTADLSYFQPVFGYRFVITGHFENAGKTDTLIEHYYSNLKHRETNKFFSNVFYDESVGLTIAQEPWSFFTSSNHNIDTLKIASFSQLFGVLWVKNDGNLLGNGNDVLEYVVQPAGWSSVNTCYLVTWTGKKWKELYSVEIRDWQLPDLPGFVTGYGLFGVEGAMALNKKYDTVNIRLERELKAFPGFVKKIKPGVVSIKCMIDAEERTIIVNLFHPKPYETYRRKENVENDDL